MHSTLTLTPLHRSPNQSETEQREFVFESATDCVVGTTPGCDIQVPPEANQDRPQLCILHFRPPMLQIEEIAGPVEISVNEVVLVTAPIAQVGSNVEKRSADVRLADGDELRIGSNAFKVHVQHEYDTEEVPLYFV